MYKDSRISTKSGRRKTKLRSDSEKRKFQTQVWKPEEQKVIKQGSEQEKMIYDVAF